MTAEQRSKAEALHKRFGEAREAVNRFESSGQSKVPI
jgi:hypothetical protein